MTVLMILETEVTDLKKVKQRLIGSLYSFEINRSQYELCPSNIGFFQPFKTPSDVQQQLKTTLVSPLVGLFSIVPNILHLIKSILIMAVSIPCISPALLIEGLVDSVAALESTIVTPLVASIVTLASLVSMVTRTLATVFSYDGGEFKNDLLSFLPKNPYKGVQASLN